MKNIPVWIIVAILWSAISFSACSSSRKSITHSDKYRTPLASERTHIITEAKAKLGTPYKYGATGPSAFDCSGFTQYVYGKVGIHLPRTSREQAVYGKHIHVNKIREGDLVVFGKGRKVKHVGICVGRAPSALWVIHASSSRGVIRENILASSYWKGRLQAGRAIVR